MGEYVWYTCTLSCGCQLRQDDFKPQPPKVGTERWCESHQKKATIVSFYSNTIPIDDYYTTVVKHG